MRTALVHLNICNTEVVVLHGLAGLLDWTAVLAGLVGRLGRQGGWLGWYQLVGWLAWSVAGKVVGRQWIIEVKEFIGI